MRRIRFALVLAVAVGLPQYASAQKNVDYRPSDIAPAARDPRSGKAMQEDVDKLKTLMDRIKQITNGKLDPNSPIDIGSLKSYGLKDPKVDVMGAVQNALNLLQEFGFIDPAENALQPDYNPRGLPALPSRAVGDANLTAEEYGTFIGLQKDINHAREFLEKNYVVLRQTEIHTKRLTDLANSAASMSGIAGVYWAAKQADVNDPMNKSKTAFYDKYDKAQKNGLDFLNDRLKKLSEFERTKYGDQNWYVYFGLPYYNFMVARYTRA
jgi:hypothetical protein